MNKIKLIYDKIRSIFAKSLNKNSSIIIYSILLSIGLWLFVSLTVYSTIKVTVHDIPIEVDLSGTNAERNGLQLVTPEEDIPTLTVRVEGERKEIGNIQAEDIIAKAVIENVNSAGTYKLAIMIEPAPGVYFTVDEMSENSVTLDFDEIISQTIPLSGYAPNVTAASGYLTGELICSPATVTVTGPKEKVESITSAIIYSEYSATLNQSYSFPGNELLLYSGNTQLSNDYFSFDKINYSLEMPVFMMKSLPLRVNFTNVQSDFKEDQLRYSLSMDAIEVSAPNSILGNVDELVLETIDIRELDLTENLDENGNYSIELPITLPSSYNNISGTESVTLTFDCSDIIKKRVTITSDQFKIIGAPSGFDIDIVTVEAYAYLIGSETILENADNLKVQAIIDLSSYGNIRNSTFVAPYHVIIDQSDGPVWALGAQTVVLQANAKEE